MKSYNATGQETNAPPNESPTLDGAGFSPGDRVLDREHLRCYPEPHCGNDIPSVGVVLDVLDLCASELEIGEDRTVADHNSEYPADDRLIQVAWECECDDRATTWRDWPIEDVQALVIQQGDSPPPWHFPETRLLPVSEAVARSEWGGAVDAALGGGDHA